MPMLLSRKIDALVYSHLIQPTTGIFNDGGFFKALVQIDEYLLNKVGSIISVRNHFLDHIENEPIVVLVYLIKLFQKVFYV